MTFIENYQQSKEESSLYSPAKIISLGNKFAENTWIRCLVGPSGGNEMWYWDKKNYLWVPDGEAYLMAWVSENCPSLSKRAYNELKFYIQKCTIIRPDKFRSNPMFIQFQNRELSFETLDWQQPDIEHYIKKSLHTELDIDNSKPPMKFLKALQKALPDPTELYSCLQAFSTILLIRTMRIEKAFFFIGSGENGKSTIMKAVENLFEDYISHVELSDLVNDRFSASQLIGKLANAYADIQSLKLKDVAIFKAISSGDIISVNAKYKDRKDEIIKVVQFYSANKVPEIENANPGFYRRVFPIIFDQVIKDQDPYIDDILASDEERKRILGLLIRVARTTRRFGFLFQKSRQEVIDIMNEKADPIRQFMSNTDYILVRPEYEIEQGKLYVIYRKFCKDHGYSPKSQSSFTRFLHDQGIESRKSNSLRIFTGIGFPTKGQAKVLFGDDE